MRITKTLVLSCLLVLTGFIIQAQEVSIKLGEPKIGLNQYFTITAAVDNDRLKQYSDFPEIDGFVKRGTSSSTSTSYINGQMKSTQSLTQNYQATEKGNFLLPPFFMTINGKDVKSNGTQIVVGDAIQQRRRSGFSSDPFEDLLGQRTQPSEFIDVEAEAFLAVTTDKKEVYVGEGFTTSLAFYVSESNRADMRFYDLGTQITELVKKLKPNSCWEESFNIDNINGESIQLNGKNYTRYKIYQATFFPLNVEDIEFPSVGLKMIKYKVAKNPSFFGRNRQEDFETFYSKEKTVKVTDLPPHPLKESVAVGNYQLTEEISTEDLETGQSFNYEFVVSGEGNISAIEAPLPQSDENFDFYAPNVQQNVSKSNSRVRGTKSYNFYAIPNEPGEYQMSDYFTWIFFNPTTEAYDTLSSELVLSVKGESRKNQYIASNDLGDFYDKISTAENDLTSLSGNSWITWVVNIFVILTMGLTLYIVFRKTAS
ncbi:MAG: BatD family protein [Cyclobacteriaceae bacterium]